MSERRVSPGRLDREIDASLRAMSAAGPAPGLRARVLAQIAAEDASPMRARPLRFALLAAAALAVAVTAVAVRNARGPAGDRGDVVPRAAAVAEGAAERRPPAAPSVVPSASPVAVTPPRARIRSSPRAASARRSSGGPLPAAVRPDGASGLPELEPPAFVSPAALADAETPPPPPLDVPGLRVEPLLDDAGDGLP